jgi:hypothetical protein
VGTLFFESKIRRFTPDSKLAAVVEVLGDVEEVGGTNDESDNILLPTDLLLERRFAASAGPAAISAAILDLLLVTIPGFATSAEYFPP